MKTQRTMTTKANATNANATSAGASATTTKPAEPVFWSERGEVACADHAPYKGTDTWIWERWTRMSAAEIDEARAEWKIAEPTPLCGCCRAAAANK